MSAKYPGTYPSKEILQGHFYALNRGSVLTIEDSIYSDVLKVLNLPEERYEQSITRYTNNGEKIIKTTKSKSMTIETVKAEFPEVFNQIFTAGIAAGKQLQGNYKNDVSAPNVTKDDKELADIDAAINEHFKDQ